MRRSKIELTNLAHSNHIRDAGSVLGAAATCRRAQDVIVMIARGEIQRPPLRGMKFFRGRRAPTDRPRFPRDATALISLIIGFTAPQDRAPRCGVTMRVFTPSGMPAVRMRCR
jgi:hypothetical protein